MQTELQPVSIRIEKATLRKLAAIAKIQNRKRTSMIRVALSEWVEQNCKPKEKVA